MKKSINCKLLSMLLALTLLLAGAVSLKPAQKASAYNTFWRSFWEAVLADLELVEGGAHICFVINYDLLQEENPNITITTNTTIEDLNDMRFFQDLARDLAEKADIMLDDVDVIDTAWVFSQINMDIVLRCNYTNPQYKNRSVNILTGDWASVANPTSLEAITDTDEDSTIYGLAHSIDPSAPFYILLYNLYHDGNYAEYNYFATNFPDNLNLPITFVSVY